MTNERIIGGARIGETCECEHADHFDDEGAPLRGHAYAIGPVEYVIKTLYGRFGICAVCHTAGHMRDTGIVIA